MHTARMIILIAVLSMLTTGILSAAPGDTLKSLPTPACCSQGLTFDGQHLWVVDRMTDMIYQIDADGGNIIDSIVHPYDSST